MKFKLKLVMILITVSLMACSGDDNEDNFTPSASDIIATIDENPTNGASLGIVAANLTGTLVYSITSQSMAGAFAINSATGEVTINDFSKFDFEISPSVTATISVTNSDETATSTVLITLNNVDDILSFLNTSRQSYIDAEIGDWIVITENEYNNLDTKLLNVSKSGASDEEINTDTSIGDLGGDLTIINDNDQTLPNGSYLFSFKYYSWDNNAASSRIKIAEDSVMGPYTDVGSILPEHNSGYNYFVIKGADNPTQSEAFLSIYTSLFLGFKSIPSSIVIYGSGNSDSLPNAAAGFLILYQGLSTTTKQWD